MRYVAALPFLLVGALTLMSAIWAMVKVAKNPRDCPDDARLMAGVWFCLVVASVALPIGAWIVGAFN